MGVLVDGVWHDQWYDTAGSGGRFVRTETSFRNWITPDGSPGPTGQGGFKAEPGRYHLYVSLACPWANRTLIFRAIKGLERMIGLSVTHWLMAENGWTFAPGEGVVPDTVNGVSYIHQLYTKADPAYSGRATVPVLWDKQRGTIVSNEFERDHPHAQLGLRWRRGEGRRLLPGAAAGRDRCRQRARLRHGQQRRLQGRLRHHPGGLRGGRRPLFETLDWLEARLRRRFLWGREPTEADWRLFTTLVRFDPVYVGHFKCNVRRLADYPALFAYTRDLYQWPGVRETVNLAHIKRHYYMSHTTINPTGIVPVGPAIDYDAPHGREKLGRP